MTNTPSTEMLPVSLLILDLAALENGSLWPSVLFSFLAMLEATAGHGVCNCASVKCIE